MKGEENQLEKKEEDRAMAKNGGSRSFLGQKRVGRIMKAANTQFGLT